MSTDQSPTTATTLSGVVPPVITPLHPDRSLDLPSLRRVIERQLDAGVDGVFVLGSTGEVAFGTDRVREQVIGTAVEVVAGRVPVLAGVIDTQTARVLEHARVAREAGADAVVATAPFYAATPPAQVERHFTVLGERAGLPVYGYDIPVCVHTRLDAAMLVRLGERGLLAGVKDSSNDDIGFRLLALANREAGEPLRLFTGHEVVVDGAYLAGAHGVVPGLGNVDPAGYVELDRLCRKGDWDQARRVQDRLAALMAITRVAQDAGGWGRGVGGFKAALRLLGVIDSDQMPEPFDGFGETDRAAVRAVLDRFGPRR